MKLDEIFSLTNEQQQELSEGPYGIGAKMKDKALGGLKSIVGGGHEERGNMMAGEKANQLMKDFKFYVGQVVGPGQKTIAGEHLMDFLEDSGIGTADIGIRSSDQLTPNEVHDVIFSVARKNFSTRKNNPNAPSAAPAQNTQHRQAPPEQRHKTPDFVMPKMHAPESEGSDIEYDDSDDNDDFAALRAYGSNKNQNAPQASQEQVAQQYNQQSSPEKSGSKVRNIASALMDIKSLSREEQAELAKLLQQR